MQLQCESGSLLHQLWLPIDKRQLTRGRRELSRQLLLSELPSPVASPQLVPVSQNQLFPVTLSLSKFLGVVSGRKRKKEKMTFIQTMGRGIRRLKPPTPATSTTTNLMNHHLPKSSAGLSPLSHWLHISISFLLHALKRQRRHLRHKVHSFSWPKLLIANSFNPLQIVLSTQTFLHLSVPSTKVGCNGNSIRLPTTRSRYPASQGIKLWSSSLSPRLRREGTPQSRSSCLPCWRLIRMWVVIN